MARVWTQGVYAIKPGRVDDFVRLWAELARHAVAEFRASPPSIFCDRDDPRVVVTFGAWEDDDALRRFRSSPYVADRAGALDELVEAAEVRILDELPGDV
jgi:quinol monooxygenase YgiN